MNKHPHLDFTPPTKAFAKNFIQPFKVYFDPQFFGIDELDVTRPAMYVTNHTILGVLDGYPFGIELYLRKGLFLRALADRNHYKIPFWRDVVQKRLGAVEASRANCSAIMERGESIVVFPGGAKELCKKKGEKYILKWSDRMGFVRMAMQYGYDIIPVAAVGAEEAYTIVTDANDFFTETVFGKFLKRTGLSKNFFKDGDLLPPTVKGIGNTILPRPEKLYFSFGKRISTKRYKSKFDDPISQEIMKDKVELALLTQFVELFDIRDKDKDKSFIRKFLTRKQ